MLPALFIALSSVAIVLGLAALWQSLRVAFGGGPDNLVGADGGLPERTALLAEKKTLLRAIKDIAFEKELGKISDEDFARLDRAYRRRAKRVLQLLDQDIEPFLERAAHEVAEAMGEEADRGPYREGGRVRRRKAKKKGAAKKSKARPKKRKPRRRAAPVEEAEPIECPQCATPNDADAVHCKECAARIAPVECPRCETENDPDSKYCKSCAEPLKTKAPEAAAPKAAAKEEEE